MDRLRRDLLYGLRRLLETPGATAVIVLSLAAGTGLNTVVFSIVHAAVFRPLPTLTRNGSPPCERSTRNDP